jgi:adenylate kinase
MGVAGAGKSVQGRQLADEMGVPWLSTGEFLRMLISGEPRKAMVKGKLVSDQQIIELVGKIFSLIDVKQEFILDGFPRTTAQADWLLNQVKHGQLKVTAVIHLIASEEIVCKRLLARGRVDDTEEAIRERFREFEETIKPIMDDFKQAGVKIFDISGEQAPNEVHEAILQALDIVL